MLAIFLDTETNGLNPFKHTLLEIAYQIVDLQTGTVHKSFSSFIRPSLQQWEASDPASLKINGLTWEIVQEGLLLSEVRNQVIDQFQSLSVQRGKAFFICQNPSFDRPFFSKLISPEEQEKLRWPYHWLDLASMFWAYCHLSPGAPKSEFFKEMSLSKDAIAARLGLPPEEKPHRALNGVAHLLACYRHFMKVT